MHAVEGAAKPIAYLLQRGIKCRNTAVAPKTGGCHERRLSLLQFKAGLGPAFLCNGYSQGVGLGSAITALFGCLGGSPAPGGPRRSVKRPCTEKPHHP